MRYTWPEEIIQVLDGPGRRVVAPSHRNKRDGASALVGILGRTTAGRELVVDVRHGAGLDWTILGARPMTPFESAEYRRWEAQR